MKQKNTIIVTGSSGGIGSVITKKLFECQYDVFGIDINSITNPSLENFIKIDLNKLCIDNEYRNEKLQKIKKIIKNKKVTGIINCAAVQIVKEFDKISLDDLQISINTNVLSNFVLVKELKKYFYDRDSFIINISSIHSKLTKSKFLPYSFSKSALDGISKAMAVELGENLNIVSISPAATDTDMLLDGLEDNKLIENLKHCHPTKTIGCPDDIANLVAFILEKKIKFMNGSNISMDGGISYQLHDVV